MISAIKANLPNIVGTFIPGAPSRYLSVSLFTGAFTGLQSHWDQGAATQGNVGDNAGVTFNASLYNDIYTDDCNTVQPPTVALIPQIKF